MKGKLTLLLISTVLVILPLSVSAGNRLFIKIDENYYGVDRTAVTSGPSTFEFFYSPPLTVYKQDGNLYDSTLIPDVDKQNLIATLTALDDIEYKSYSSYEQNYQLGIVAGAFSAGDLIETVATDASSVLRSLPENLVDAGHSFFSSTLGLVVNASLQIGSTGSALAVANNALAIQKFSLDAAKRVLTKAIDNNLIDYREVKGAYYALLSSNVTGSAAWTFYSIIIEQTTVSLLDALKDTATTNVPFIGAYLSAYAESRDATELMWEMIFAVPPAVNAWLELMENNIFTNPLDHFGASIDRAFNDTSSNIAPSPTFYFNTVTPEVGEPVTLNASGSSDQDGDVISYRWKLSGPIGSTATIEQPTAETSSFIPDIEGVYLVELVVTDGIASSNVSGDLVASAPTINKPPVAIISTNSNSVNINTQVTLSASSSYDPEGKLLAGGHTWELIKANGSSAQLSASTGEIVSFIPEIAGFYLIRLTVNDGEKTGSTTLQINATKTYASDELVILELGKIYIEEIGVSKCTIDNVKIVTVPNDQRWSKIRFVYSSPRDLVILASEGEWPDFRSGDEDKCPSGYMPRFNADFEHDYADDGTGQDHEWNKDFGPGDKIYISLFSFDGFTSGYGINGDVEVSIDQDGDMVPDDKDYFPSNPSEQYDSDLDTVGDNADQFDNDPAAWQDTDNDGCPNSINGTSSTGLVLDLFPSNSNLCIDNDGDNVDDRTDDLFPSDISEWADEDLDGIGDNTDKFANDPSASVDSDNDGYPNSWNPGNSQLNSTTGLVLDIFPDNPNEFEDSDFDGVGNNSDWAPNDLNEWADTDNDGVGDNADVAPNDPSRYTNAAPELGKIIDQTVSPGTTSSVPLSINDSDGDETTVKIIAGPNFLSILNKDVVISPTNSDGGTYSIVLQVIDNYGGEVTRSFLLTIPDFIKGDVNSDDIINLKDLILVLQILSGKTPSIDINADVNNDGKIGIPEAIYQLKLISGVQTEFVYENDSAHIYIDNINIDSNSCQLLNVGSFTVPVGEKWTQIKFAASQGDIILLADDGTMPSLDTSSATFQCVNGYSQKFDSDQEYDWYNGTQIFTWEKELIPGDTLYLAVFSYGGNVSNYSINTKVSVTGVSQ